MAPIPTSGVTSIAFSTGDSSISTAVTGRAGRGRNAIELRQNLGADPADEGDVQRVRQPMFGMAVECHPVAEPA